jgi:hypothetical protein
VRPARALLGHHVIPAHLVLPEQFVAFADGSQRLSIAGAMRHAQKLDQPLSILGLHQRLTAVLPVPYAWGHRPLTAKACDVTERLQARRTFSGKFRHLTSALLERIGMARQLEPGTAR